MENKAKSVAIKKSSDTKMVKQKIYSKGKDIAGTHLAKKLETLEALRGKIQQQQQALAKQKRLAQIQRPEDLVSDDEIFDTDSESGESEEMNEEIVTIAKPQKLIASMEVEDAESPLPAGEDPKKQLIWKTVIARLFVLWQSQNETVHVKDLNEHQLNLIQTAFVIVRDNLAEGIMHLSSFKKTKKRLLPSYIETYRKIMDKNIPTRYQAFVPPLQFPVPLAFPSADDPKTVEKEFCSFRYALGNIYSFLKGSVHFKEALVANDNPKDDDEQTKAPQQMQLAKAFLSQFSTLFIIKALDFFDKVITIDGDKKDTLDDLNYKIMIYFNNNKN